MGSSRKHLAKLKLNLDSLRMRYLSASIALLFSGFILAASAPAAETVKVFVLAGQSNMEGKVQSKLMNFQATDGKTKELFTHLRDGEDWITRDDVMIKFLKQHGGLTVGYGSGDRTGVELESSAGSSATTSTNQC